MLLFFRISSYFNMCVCPELEQIVGLPSEVKILEKTDLECDWFGLKGDSLNLIHVVVNVCNI